jgi:carbamate kinase
VEQDGRLEGVDAVVDKDLASAVLAEEIEASELYILTAVDKVAVNFGKPNERYLDIMTVKEARQYLAEGQFPKGNMGPKIEAAIKFLEHGGSKVLISSVERMPEAIAGKTGTEIIR